MIIMKLLMFVVMLAALWLSLWAGQLRKAAR